MDGTLEIVVGGAVDVVLAQDADRISREPWHFVYLEAKFEPYGTRLRALDYGDDETP
jgi:DNA invertase Pin-like site-specific DNA recombinase